MTDAERALRFFRVSSDKQDETNQETEVDGHISSRGYEVGGTVRLHDVSAYHGAHEADLVGVLAGIRRGDYTVVVVAHSSRIDRRDPDVAEAFHLAVRQAGGRIESVREPEFGKSDLGGKIVTLISQFSNNAYSAAISGNVRAAFERIDTNEAFRGLPPWGLTTTGERYSKHLVATAVGAEYLPLIFRRVAAGESLHAVARWLTEQGVKPRGIRKEREDGRGKSGKWWAHSVGKIIRNAAYAGHVTDSMGRTTYAWQGIVSPSLWQDANKSLDTRPQRRSGPRSAGECEPLSSNTYCYPCSLRGTDSPMYLTAGLLRCTGRGADRHGCGNCLPLGTARKLADRYLGGLAREIFEITTVPGNEATLRDRRSRLDLERRQVAMAGLSFDAEDSERARLRAEYEALDAAVVVPDVRDFRPTGESYGQRWNRLSADGRAAWLKSGEVAVMFGRDLSAEAHPDATESVTTMRGGNQFSAGTPRTVTYGLVAAWDSTE